MAKISRRSLLGAAGLVAVAGVTAACRSSTSTSGESSGTTYSLSFDASKYTEKTATVTTAAGSQEITYRLYSKIPYVAKPVDVDYQSLTIAVPTKIGGTAVDASDAPILFEIPVGGYMAAKTTADPFATGSGSGPGGGTMPSGGPGGMMPSGGLGGAMPSGGPGAMPGGGTGTGNALPTGVGSMGQNMNEAIAAGWVVVSVGARGRDNQSADGKYFGKAPAVIVDLKAAVRYLRSNKDKLPGDTDKIVSDGTSAGGAVSALLGASGDSDLYASYLTELGAADAGDAVFAVAAYCPITDLENADQGVRVPLRRPAGQRQDRRPDRVQDAGGRVPGRSGRTEADRPGRQGADRGPLPGLPADLLPAARRDHVPGRALGGRADPIRGRQYVADLVRRHGHVHLRRYLKHLAARKKTVPAFDAFDLSAGENSEFGTTTTAARHFTAYGAEHDTKASGGRLDADIPDLRTLMNPMHFLTAKNPGRAKNWFFRVGTSDTDTALTVSSNLAAGFHAVGDTVDTLMYWDAGHAVNQDPAKFIAWAKKVTA